MATTYTAHLRLANGHEWEHAETSPQTLAFYLMGALTDGCVCTGITETADVSAAGARMAP
jgi:hypothetical protein